MAVEIRKSFHQDLAGVTQDVVRLAGMVTEALGKATQALLDGDLVSAEEIIVHDDVLDDLALEIEDRCYQLLTLQQPMAADLRALVTAIRLSSEIERSGDLVVNTMKAARRMYPIEFSPKLRGLIQRLGEQVHHLYRQAIDAYVDRNAPLAAALDDMDDIVDALHADYIQAIFETHGQGTTDLQPAVQLALVGRYYERIGDHAVNIGERVSYMVTGRLPDQAEEAAPSPASGVAGEGERG